MFLKHGLNLYSWTQYEDSKIENVELFFVAKTDGNDLHQPNNSMFYFVKDLVNDKEELIGQVLKRIQINYSFFYREELYMNKFNFSNERISAIHLD